MCLDNLRDEEREHEQHKEQELRTWEDLRTVAPDIAQPAHETTPEAAPGG